MKDELRFFLNRIGEKLWVRPLVICIFSIAIAFIAQWVDQLSIFHRAPEINSESITMLLKVISASMLVMAVFAVGSMLAAYQSASSSATPRAFTLVVSDDVSQNALSTFIGAFIFSIVAQVALMNGYYDKAGRFILFIITLLVFAIVIIRFIRWVDGIAQLGRLSTTIAKVEKATSDALERRIEKPYLGGRKALNKRQGLPVLSSSVGYIQRLDMNALQTTAANNAMLIEVTVLPGSFVTLNQPLAYLSFEQDMTNKTFDTSTLTNAFVVNNNRTFDDDPRFGLITLSEIGSRALSPAVNDPGTAIEITGIFVRLFSKLAQPVSDGQTPSVEFNRVAIPEIAFSDLFEDAFNAMARDGAGTIEVVVRMLKALDTLNSLNNESIKTEAIKTAQRVVAYAENELSIAADLKTLKQLSIFALDAN